LRLFLRCGRCAKLQTGLKFRAKPCVEAHNPIYLARK
jgi:hypothetical protein